jgi:hypothetical protein
MIQVGASQANWVSFLVQHDHRAARQIASALRALRIAPDEKNDELITRAIGRGLVIGFH